MYAHARRELEGTDGRAAAAPCSRRRFLATSTAAVAGLSLPAAARPGPGAPAGRKAEAKITLVQLTSRDGPDAAVGRMPGYFEQAARHGSDLIVFPEYVLGRRITVEHPRVRRFLDLTRDHGMYSIAGLVETSGSRWSTTALVVDRGGRILGRYLKTHPASGPAPHWWPPIPGHDHEARGILGSEFKVFRLDFGAIGVLQCYDGYFPEAWGCTSWAGAEIILWINGRAGMVEDSHCRMAAEAYGCVVGANISDGKNTGFAGPGCVRGEGTPEEARLFPRLSEPGDGCVHATIDLGQLRWRRKHLRTMHQRRPELYGRLTRDVRMWQDYPEIPWDHPECADLVNRAQL